jgi:hypothetical protein
MIIFIAALIVLIAACFVIVAAHLCWFGLFLNLEIKPIEVLTLAVDIIIALLLQYYFVSKASDFRAEKDLLIDNIRDVLGVIRACREIVNSCYEAGKIGRASAKQIITHFRRISNGIEHLEAAIAMSQCKRLSADMKIVRESYVNFKEAATGGSFPSKVYSPSSISEQEQACKSLNSHLQSLIFRINKYR